MSSTVPPSPEDHDRPRFVSDEAAARLMRELRSAGEVPSAPEPGSTPAIPGYRIVRNLGEGGGGQVFECIREGTDRHLALKVLRRSHGSEGGNKRAWRELDVLAQLHIAGAPSVNDYGIHEGRLFIVTDLVQGQPLDDYVQAHQLDRKARIALLARVADLIHSLHERGVIHRDVKPANVIIDSNGDPVIIDFGIASLLTDDVIETLTINGQPLGSPAYMSPEQARGDVSAISTRSDVFSLGATGFMLLVNTPPFDLDVSLHEAVRRVAQDQPRNIRELDSTIPKPLAAVMNKAVAADPGDRYESAAAFAMDLRRWLKGEPVEAQSPNLPLRAINAARRRPRTWLAAAALAVVVLSVTIAQLIAGAAARNTYVVLDSITSPRGFRIEATYPQSLLGSSIAVGDVTGDGALDIIVGAQGAPDPFGREGEGLVGTIHILPGPVGTANITTDDPRILTIAGDDAHGGFGARVGIAGDMNGDGFDDLFVSSFASPNDVSPQPTCVHIVFGGPGLAKPGTILASAAPHGGLRVRQPSADDGFGWFVASLGDMNRDGLDDLAIGAPLVPWKGLSKAGALHIVWGSRALTQRKSLDVATSSVGEVVTVRSEIKDATFGRSIAVVGDLNGDGTSELAIGAPDMGSGRTYVVNGRSVIDSQGTELIINSLAPNEIAIIDGIADKDAAGYSLANAGDVNADGTDDLVIGAIQIGKLNADSGMAFVVFGGTGLRLGSTLRLDDLNGTNGFAMTGFPSNRQGFGDLLGQLASGAGDFNGDGIADLAVNAPRANPGGNDSGAAFLVFGSRDLGASGHLDLTSLTWPKGIVLRGGENSDGAGAAFGIGDVNGDGVTDFLIGAPHEDPWEITDAGTVYVTFGRR